MALRAFATTCLILRRQAVGEQDGLYTLLAQAEGKFVARVNGVRRLQSKKRAHLEPGNLVLAHFQVTKSLPLLTQTRLLSESAEANADLAHYRRLSLFLELCEKLFVEAELEESIFTKLLTIRAGLLSGSLTTKQVQAIFAEIIVQLGYQHPGESRYATISDYVGALAERPIHSYHFLSPV